MNAFYGPGGRRALGDEVLARIADRVGATPVMGFAEIIDVGDARAGSERIGGFSERHDLREYLLPLSGTRPMLWRSAAVEQVRHPRVCFALSLGFGNGSSLPQLSGQWHLYVNDHFAVSLRVVNHSQLWRAGECALAFAANRLESAPPFSGLTLSSLVVDEAFATFGPALLVVPASWVEAGQPAVIRVEPKGDYPSERWISVEAAPALFEGTDIYRAIDVLAGSPPEVGGLHVHFGDIHTHSGQVVDECANRGCGMGSRVDNYEFARGPGGLDFYALTDHEYQVGPDEVDRYLGLADEYTENGRFVCLPAFEFTNRLYGHRNVYFRGSGGTVVNASRDGKGPHGIPDLTLTPDELWAALEKTRVPFITVPHHPSATSHPLTWEHFCPKYDRLAEVYSVWGSSEYYGDFPRGVSDRYRDLGIRDALDSGLRFGLIASADGHDGHPGDAQSPLVKHHHQFHLCGSGRAAVLAPRLTREDVFDALHARRCYATTGPPIVLDVTLNGELMGSELSRSALGKRRRLRVACQGTNGIDHVRIVRNGRVVERIPGYGEFDLAAEWIDPADADELAHYYARVVQVDRESAWSSPIFVG